MRWALYIVGLCLVVASAAWSYRATYHTQAALDVVADLRRDIRLEREALSVLKAEWAFLNRPARLEKLIREQGGSLDLAALAPDQFAELSEVPYPPIDDGMEPVALIDLDDAGPETIFAPAPIPRPIIRKAGLSE